MHQESFSNRFGLVTALFAAFALLSASAAAESADAGVVADMQQLLEVETAVAEVAEAILDATVSVRSGIGRGSGVLVEPEGLVLTAAHVAGHSGETVMIGLRDGRVRLARTLGCDYEADICLLRINDAGPYPAATLGEDVTESGWVLATGHPGGQRPGRDPLLRIGRVLGRVELPMVGARILTDAPVINGDSGGPLFDLRGRVIGIHSSTGIAMTGLNSQHAPVEAIRGRWNALLDGAEFGSPWFVPGELEGPAQGIGSVSSQSAAELPDALRRLAESGKMRVLHPGELPTPGLADEAPGSSMAGGEKGGEKPKSTPRVMAFKVDVNNPQATSEIRAALLGMSKAAIDGQGLGLQRDRLRDSDAALEVVAPIVRNAAVPIVEIVSADEPVALGMVVAGQDLVVTKASTLGDAYEVRLGADRYPARLIASDAADDLALLHVDGLDAHAEPLPTPVPPVGRWLVTPDADGRAAALGIVSHGKINSDAGHRIDAGVSLGVDMARAVGTARVRELRPDGPAARAGLLAGDVIMAIDGQHVANAAELEFRLHGAVPSVPVRLDVVRDGRKLEFVVELQPAVAGPMAGSATVAFVSGLIEALSERREDFPLVFLHDSPLPANRVGGPVLDESGRVVGLNIARVDRSTTAAIPIERVHEWVGQVGDL